MAYQPRPVFRDVNRSHALLSACVVRRTPGPAQRQKVAAMLVSAGCPDALASEAVDRNFDLEWTDSVGWTLWLLGQGVPVERSEQAEDVIPELVRRVVESNEDERQDHEDESLW